MSIYKHVNPQGFLITVAQRLYYGSFHLFLSLLLLIILSGTTVIQTVGQTEAFSSSNLPIVIIDTRGQQIRDEGRILVDFGIIDNGSGQRNYLTDPFNDYDGQVSIEYRGASSQMFAKKQFAVETKDTQGNDMDVSLLGMPVENDWVLYAPYSDKTLMRNVIAFQLASNMGRYASRSRLCELVLNGQYWGVYVLLEKIKRDKNRVNIAKLDSSDIVGDPLTGGYIIKLDKISGSHTQGWNSIFPPFPGTRKKIYYQYHYPKFEDLKPEQIAYIKNFIYYFENTMSRDNYADSLLCYLDLDSFIDYLLVNECAKNVDAFRLSAFMYKDRSDCDGRLKMGPIWDMDLAFGNADYYDGFTTTGWVLRYLTEDQFFLNYDSFLPPFWWKILGNDTTFLHRLYNRWQELKGTVFNRDLLLQRIDSLANVLQEAQVRNFQRWPVLGIYVWPNYYIGATYQDEVDYFKQWLSDRLQWLEENMPVFCCVTMAGKSDPMPSRFSIKQNYPNVFRQLTTIEYRLESSGQINIVIYDLLGREIKTLIHQQQLSGIHQVTWDGTDQFGQAAASGVYLYRMTAIAVDGSFDEIKKMTLVR